MPRFITIGYGDEAGYRQTAKAVLDRAHAADAERIGRGDIMGIAGTPVQVRNHDAAEVSVSSGPYLTSKLPVAGFALIEARDLEEAIAIASRAPCAVAHGVVEVWPLEQTPDANS